MRTTRNPLTPEQFIEQLRALRDQLPEFVPLSSEELQRMGKTPEAAVDGELELAAISLIGMSEPISSVVGASAEELHGAREDLDRWSSVEGELRTTLRGVAGANVMRRHRIARIALRAYGIGRQLVRDEQHVLLRPHIARMAELRKRARSRKKEKEPTGEAT